MGMEHTAVLAERNRELKILNSLANALNRSVSLQAALDTTLAEVADLFGLETGWIWLTDAESKTHYLAAARNLPPALRDDPALMEGSCSCIDSFWSGDLDGAANVNVITCTRLKDLIDGTDGLRHHASVPLYAQDGSEMGILNVASRDWRELTDTELQLLYTIGGLLSIAIERARLFGRSLELGALKERNRLAREIHDGLAQHLSAITLHLEALAAQLEATSGPPPVQQSVQRILGLARDGLEDARRSVLDLRAAPLEGRSLPDAIQRHANAWSERTGIDAVFSHAGASRPLSPAVEVGLFRVVQEALTNVEKHAQAACVEIELQATPAEIRLTISDDGQGFDTAAFKRENSSAGQFGVRGMAERVKLLGGRMGIESEPDAGTAIAVHIPVTGKKLGKSSAHPSDKTNE